MNVRRARPEDADAFFEVIAAVAAERVHIATEPEDLDRGRVDRMLAAETRDVVWVLEDTGRIVGCLGLRGTRRPEAASLGMAILQEARGKGGGHALVRAAIEHARAVGLSTLELEVFPDNHVAIALYEAYDFAVAGHRPRSHPRRDGTVRGTLVMTLGLDSVPARSPRDRASG
jgi:putative acetyltransferase